MTKFLIRLFVPRAQEVEDSAVRKRYGNLASLTGAVVNLLLFALKLLLGMLSGSIAVMADAFNNLSDIGSNVVTFLGFKLAAQPPDEKHPFGHGRMEYLSGLLIAVLVFMVGVEIIKSSVAKIITPQVVEFRWIVVLGLALSIALKLWLAVFYKFIARRIDSGSLRAASSDSENDCVSTAASMASLLVLHFFSLNIDGWLGLAVGVFILWAGFQIIRETLAPLLGSPPDPALTEQVEQIMRAYPICVGVHDMVIHDYGPGRLMGSAHMEVPAECNILEAHDEIDNAERDILQTLRMPFTIHMDPVETQSEEVLSLWADLGEALHSLDPEIKFHDFRAVFGESHINLIFDVVLPFDCGYSGPDVHAVCKAAFAGREVPHYCVITFDRPFVG